MWGGVFTIVNQLYHSCLDEVLCLSIKIIIIIIISAFLIGNKSLFITNAKCDKET